MDRDQIYDHDISIYSVLGTELLRVSDYFE